MPFLIILLLALGKSYLPANIFATLTENTMHKIEILQADAPFEIEISGSPDADTAVIFVHGFGVKRDSRGMFPAIASRLPSSWLYIRGEFSEVNPQGTQALPFSKQVKRLQAIGHYVEEHFSIQNTIYIGHSQGSLVVAQAKPKGSTLLLLAPPVASPYEEFIKTKGWQNPGSYLNVHGLSRLVRSDLIIDITPEFWDEFRKVDAIPLYSALAKDNKVKIFFAGADEVLGQQVPPAEISSATIPDANHDFKGVAREVLITLITQEIY